MAKLLIIRHGALGDFVFSTGLMKALRRQHPSAQLTLLTQPFLASFAAKLGCFDEIWTDPRSHHPLDLLRICRRIAQGGFDIVYDLQSNQRTLRLYRPLVWALSYGRIDWRHFGSERFDVELAAPDLSDVHGDLTRLPTLPKRFVLLVPGCSPKNPEKRWPADRFRALSDWLGDRGIGSVVLGTKAETDEISAICRDNPHAVSLMGLTTLADLPDLARQALAVVGNDTGPTHLCRLTGTATVLLLPPYSAHLAREADALKPLLAQQAVAEIPVATVINSLSSFIP